MFKDWTYQEAVEKASALKAIGDTEIYLSKGVFPWHLVTHCSPGGSHRMEISTDVWFYAHDPVTELDFRWSFDIEPRSANGSGTYHIDFENCKVVMDKLPVNARESFQLYLRTCSTAISKQIAEIESRLNDERKAVEILNILGNAVHETSTSR